MSDQNENNDQNKATLSSTDSGDFTDPKLKSWMIISLVLAVIGLGISLYTVSHHLEVKATGATNAACNINQTFNCDDVALSEYSEIAGIPVGVFGVGYFAGILFLLIGAHFKPKLRTENLHGFAGMVLIGVLVSVVMGSLSMFAVKALCINCMLVYGVTLIQLVLLVMNKGLLPPGLSFKSVSNGCSTAAILVVLVVGGYNFFGPKPSPQSQQNAEMNPNGEIPMLADKAENIPLSLSAYSGLGEDYRQGNDRAKVVLVEFADFQCPACKQMSDTLSLLKKDFGSSILVVFKNFPLDNSCNSGVSAAVHPNACDAAIVARCAGQLGRFWQVHDQIFANQGDLSRENLDKWAMAAGVSQEQLKRCREAPDLINKVKDDIAIGNTIGVRATPTLYINGRKLLSGQTYSRLRVKIQELLEQ